MNKRTCASCGIMLDEKDFPTRLAKYAPSKGKQAAIVPKNTCFTCGTLKKSAVRLNVLPSDMLDVLSDAVTAYVMQVITGNINKNERVLIPGHWKSAFNNPEGERVKENPEPRLQGEDAGVVFFNMTRGTYSNMMEQVKAGLLSALTYSDIKEFVTTGKIHFMTLEFTMEASYVDSVGAMHSAFAEDKILLRLTMHKTAATEYFLVGCAKNVSVGSYVYIPQYDLFGKIVSFTGEKDQVRIAVVDIETAKKRKIVRKEILASKCFFTV